MSEIITIEQARQETYGEPWNKRAYRDGFCVHGVWTPCGRGSSHSQCSRKNGFGPSGLYCKQHDPEAVAKKKAEQSAKWDAEAEAKQKRWKRQAECLNALAGIPAPEAALKEAREAIERLLPFLPTEGDAKDEAALNDGRCSEYAVAALALRKALAAISPKK